MTWQQWVRVAVLIVVACAVALLLGVRAEYVPLPARAIFAVVLVLLCSPTVAWWAWADERLAAIGREGVSSAGTLRQTGAARGLLAAYAMAVLLPMMVMPLAPHVRGLLPVPALMWLMAWHVTLLMGGVIVFGLVLARTSLRPLRRLVAAPTPSREQGDTAATRPDEPSLSRRTVLQNAFVAAPLIITGGTVTAGLWQQGRFVVRRRDIKLPGLPDRLQGLTITHVSDFHVGRLFRPEHLPAVVEAVNRLDSDLIAVTGDVVDHSVEMFEPALEAFGQMRSRHGRYVVLGNHDLIHSPMQARQYLRQEPNFLEDAGRTLDIDGERLQLVGLGWSRYDKARFGTPGLRERTETVMAMVDPDLFTLALSHHPHAFDYLADAGADLTLAGHTHGGQIMFTPQGSPAPLGGGTLLFRYIWGEYRRGTAAMHVSSGVGNWFPVRVNAAAEIVQIRLM